MLLHGRGILKIRESVSRLFLVAVIVSDHCKLDYIKFVYGHCGFSYSQFVSRNTGKIILCNNIICPM